MADDRGADLVRLALAGGPARGEGAVSSQRAKPGVDIVNDRRADAGALVGAQQPREARRVFDRTKQVVVFCDPVVHVIAGFEDFRVCKQVSDVLLHWSNLHIWST